MKQMQFIEIKRKFYQNMKSVWPCLIGYSLFQGICYIIFYLVYLKFGYVFIPH